MDFFFGGFLASRFGAFLFPMPTASHRIEVDARGQQRKLHLDPPFFFKSRICNLDARRRERSCFKGCLSRIRVAVSGSGWSTPVQACIPSCKKGEALAEVATQSLLPASGSAFPVSSAGSEAAPLLSFLSTAANRCIPRSWPFPFGVNVYRLVTPSPFPGSRKILKTNGWG